MELTGRFDITSWDEETYADVGDHGKMTRAKITQSFRGDLEGDGQVEYLMTYTAEDTARFVGQQWIHGDAGEMSGSVVLQLSGVFDGDTAQATCTVVEGSGTGDFAGMTGQGGFSAPLGEEASYTLAVELDKT
jgi:hypothetical protein